MVTNHFLSCRECVWRTSMKPKGGIRFTNLPTNLEKIESCSSNVTSPCPQTLKVSSNFTFFARDVSVLLGIISDKCVDLSWWGLRVGKVFYHLGKSNQLLGTCWCHNNVLGLHNARFSPVCMVVSPSYMLRNNEWNKRNMRMVISVWWNTVCYMNGRAYSFFDWSSILKSPLAKSSSFYSLSYPPCINAR